MLNAMAMMAVPWKPAIALPEDNVNPPIQVMSNEVATQNIRMSTTAAARYSSENEVPIGPKTLTDVEKALELSSGITSAPSIIPFFTPQEVAPNADSLLSTMTNAAPVFAPPPAVPNASSSEATIETVLTMGLPLFLVGSNIQALQTLAAAPGLLDTFRDANGVYDQPRLMNLVQTLTQNIAPAQASQPQHIGYGGSNPSQNSMNYYQPTPTPYAPPGQSFGAQNAYPAPTLASQQQSSQQSRGMGGGYRGDQNIGEANLHLSGYGPGTTDDDIIALFAPYVHVTEVVQKGTFSFVNTRDPDGAQRAREALSGALLCGTPVRINIATRKAKKPMSELNTMKPSSGGASTLPRNNMGQIAFDQVSIRGCVITNFLLIIYFCIQTDQSLPFYLNCND